MPSAGVDLAESHLSEGVSLPGIDASTVVLITGGTGAIGYRTAETFLRLGARVALMSRVASTVEGAARTLAELGEVMGLPGDVALEADDERAVAEVIGRFGRLDVVVNCAAVGGNVALEELSPERIDQLLAVNVKGSILIAKAAAAPMRAQGRGRIINVSSIMGHRSLPKSALYGSSKAAVGHLTRALATELGPSGITVNCVSPANTPTAVRLVDEEPGTPARPASGGGTADDVPLRRRGELDDFVGPILFFASDLASYVTGADVLIDGGSALLRA